MASFIRLFLIAILSITLVSAHIQSHNTIEDIEGFTSHHSSSQWASIPPYNLWPMPQSFTYGPIEFPILYPCDFTFAHNLPEQFNNLFDNYKSFLFQPFCDTMKSAARQNHPKASYDTLTITVEDPTQFLMLTGTDESYTLNVAIDKMTLTSKTCIGAIRGLQTFSQLITGNVTNPLTGRQVPLIPATPVTIVDQPRFPHRGVMLDTSRHFISKDNIIKILDGMMYAKLNVFHWHLSDSDSIGFFFPSHPNLTSAGAYSESQVYSQGDIQAITQHAIMNGIRIIPELDSPAHVGGLAYASEARDLINCTLFNGYQKGYIGTPLGQMDPTKNETYEFLQDLLQDFEAYFPWNVTHLGADEVDPYCWNNTELYEFFAALNITDFPGYFNYYVSRMRKIVNPSQSRMYWLNPATTYLNFEPEDVLQWWGNLTQLLPTFQQYPNNKFVLSNFEYFYLDCGFGGSHGGESWCDPVVTWDQIYAFPVNTTELKDYEDQILGLEACLWTEMVNDAVVLGRIFPRVAVVGEKAWTNDIDIDEAVVVKRLVAWINSSRARGVSMGPITEGFCESHADKCFN